MSTYILGVFRTHDLKEHLLHCLFKFRLHTHMGLFEELSRYAKVVSYRSVLIVGLVIKELIEHVVFACA